MAQIDYWTFDGTIVDGLTSPIVDRQLGTEQTVGCVFRPAGRTRDHTTRYQTVRDYARYAGETPTGRAYQGGVWYQEQLDATAPVESLIVPVTPEPGQPGTPFEGFWALVTGYTDDNRLTNRIELAIDIVYLGDASDYVDRQAVEAALGTAPL